MSETTSLSEKAVSEPRAAEDPQVCAACRRVEESPCPFELDCHRPTARKVSRDGRDFANDHRRNRALIAEADLHASSLREYALLRIDCLQSRIVHAEAEFVRRIQMFGDADFQNRSR